MSQRGNNGRRPARRSVTWDGQRKREIERELVRRLRASRRPSWLALPLALAIAGGVATTASPAEAARLAAGATSVKSQKTVVVDRSGQQSTTQTDATTQTDTTAQSSQTSQTLRQIQFGCRVDCDGTTLTQDAVQSNVTEQTITQTDATATQTATQQNTTAQRLVQVQIGCVAFCSSTTQTQTALQTDATTQTIGQTQDGATIADQQATQSSQTQQSVKQIQIVCRHDCTDVTATQSVTQSSSLAATTTQAQLGGADTEQSQALDQAAGTTQSTTQRQQGQATTTQQTAIVSSQVVQVAAQDQQGLDGAGQDQAVTQAVATQQDVSLETAATTRATGDATASQLTATSIADVSSSTVQLFDQTQTAGADAEQLQTAGQDASDARDVELAAAGAQASVAVDGQTNAAWVTAIGVAYGGTQQTGSQQQQADAGADQVQSAAQTSSAELGMSASAEGTQSAVSSGGTAGVTQINEEEVIALGLSSKTTGQALLQRQVAGDGATQDQTAEQDVTVQHATEAEAAAAQSAANTSGNGDVLQANAAASVGVAAGSDVVTSTASQEQQAGADAQQTQSAERAVQVEQTSQAATSLDQSAVNASGDGSVLQASGSFTWSNETNALASNTAAVTSATEQNQSAESGSGQTQTAADGAGIDQTATVDGTARQSSSNASGDGAVTQDAATRLTAQSWNDPRVSQSVSQTQTGADAAGQEQSAAQDGRITTRGAAEATLSQDSENTSGDGRRRAVGVVGRRRRARQRQPRPGRCRGRPGQLPDPGRRRRCAPARRELAGELRGADRNGRRGRRAARRQPLGRRQRPAARL
jgi:hypothetical protein